MGIRSVVVLGLGLLAIGADRSLEERKALEDAGRVRYAYYDPAAERRAYPGRTEFDLRVSWRGSIRYETRREGDGLRVRVWPLFDRVEVTVRHTVELPRGADPMHPVHEALLDHELDHVAISADPRVKEILEREVRKIGPIEVRLERGERPEVGRLSERVDEAAQGLARRMIEAIGFHYRELDERTRHGNRPLEGREAFFAGLYTAAGLRRAGFTYGIAGENEGER